MFRRWIFPLAKIHGAMLSPRSTRVGNVINRRKAPLSQILNLIILEVTEAFRRYIQLCKFYLTVG